jgi:hypothetical protein
MGYGENAIFRLEELLQCQWYPFSLSGIESMSIIADIKQTHPTVFMVAISLAPEY